MRKVDNLDVTAKLVLAVGAGAAIYLIAVPLAMLLFAAFRGPADYLPFEPGAHWTLEHVRALFTDPLIYTRILPDTLIFVAGTVLVVFAIGLGLAWLVERTNLPGREIWFSLILFPLLVPTPVLAIAWIFLMGPNAGWLNLAIRAAFGMDGSGPIDIFSMGGLVLCQALASTPFVFLLLAATLRAMDPALEEASSTSGASPVTTFRRVTLPVLLPGLLAPLILITLITAEQFELPLIIGLPAKINVFSYRIYFELNPLIVSAIGALLGWIISRSQIRFRHALDFLSVFSVGIPAVIAGLAVMLLYLSLPIGIYGTVWILIIAYSYRFATTTRLARAGFMQIYQELEEASATSGARWTATQRRVLIPLMLPVLAAGFILLFIVGVREFTIALVLYSPDNVVLSVLLWHLFQSGQPAPSAALASIIVAVALPVIFLARRTLARRALAG